VVSKPQEPLKRCRQEGEAGRNAELSQGHKADPRVALVLIDDQAGRQHGLQRGAVHREMQEQGVVPQLVMHEAHGPARRRGLAQARDEGACNPAHDSGGEKVALRDGRGKPTRTRIG
jgi:hypothetical protein